MRSIVGACLLGLILSGVAVFAADADEISKLIEQLGDDDLAKRREASKRLEAMGATALELLRKAEKDSVDPDVRLRAGLVIRTIQDKGWGEVRVITGPARGYWLNRVAFSGDGKYAVAGGGAVILFDLETGKEVQRVLEVGSARHGLSMSKDGKLCLTGHTRDRTVHLVEVPSGKEVQTFTGHAVGVQGVALSADGTRAASCGEDRVLRVWDAKNGKELFRCAGFPDAPRCAAFSPDGKYLLSGHHGKRSQFKVHLWNAKDGKEVRSYKGHTNAVTAVAFAPDGRRFVSASLDGTIRLWDTESGKELRSMKHDGGVYDLALSANGQRAITAGFDDKNVRVWDLKSGKEIHRFTGHRTHVLGVALSSDGQRALSSDADCTIRLWRLPP
jgi:WD40 repeat protein